MPTSVLTVACVEGVLCEAWVVGKGRGEEWGHGARGCGLTAGPSYTQDATQAGGKVGP